MLTAEDLAASPASSKILAVAANGTDAEWVSGGAGGPHTHEIDDVTGLQAALDGKVAEGDARLSDARAPTAHAHDWDAITDKPATFDPSSHAHATSEVTGLDAALASKVDASDARLTDARTPLAHTHATSEIVGLDAALTARELTANKGAANGYASLGEDGKVPAAQLPASSGGGMSTLRTTGDQIVNGTAYRDITDLTFPVSSNTDYAFKFYIVFRSTTATGFKFAINGPASSTADYFMTYQTVANATTAGVATWLQGHWVTYDAMTATTASIAAGADLVCMIEGRVKVNGTAGTIAARVGSESANNDLVIQRGSWGFWF